MTVPRAYCRWFYAAAAYNLLWAVVVSAVPARVIALLQVGHLVTPIFLQVIGMMIGVYAYGYWLLAREPLRYSGFIWIGLFGKLFGVLGFLFYALRGDLPWTMGLTIVTNDLLWLPAFGLFAWKYARPNAGAGM